jgi:dCTP deaminase
LGIVFSNASTNYLKIYPGEPIAKIEFSRMEHPVRRAYHGQHGYQTKIWPIPTDMILSKEEINADQRILDADRELELSYGPEIPRVLARINRYERPLVIASCIYFVFILLLFALITKELAVPIGIGVAVGIVANVLTGFLTHGATDFLREKR